MKNRAQDLKYTLPKNEDVQMAHNHIKKMLNIITHYRKAN